MAREVHIQRETKETNISLFLDLDQRKNPEFALEGLPFFQHLLHAMTFHGGFYLKIDAGGDVEVDQHHLVEDTGLVLGKALRESVEQYGPVVRFAHFVIPMDEAVSEVTLDASGRPYLVFDAEFPQDYAGDFPLCLVEEFLTALSNSAGLTLHASCRYGSNSHHMAECLFKALGKAIRQAYTSLGAGEQPLSTKGSL